MQVLNRLLSEEQLALLPTEADIAFYEEHGWYISPKVLPDDLLDEMVEAAEHYAHGHRDLPLPIKAGFPEADPFKDWKPEDGDALRNNEFTSLQSLQLRKLARHPVIGAIAARLARTSSIRLLDDQLISKAPTRNLDKTTIGWHADKAYWSTCTSDRLLTAWIPLQDCTEALGPLVVWDGSHKWSWNTLQDTRFFNQNNHQEFEQHFRQRGHKIVQVPMTLKRGQMSFHHCWVVHGSHPNRADRDRMAMAVHLQDEANRYQPFWNNGEPIHILEDFLCRRLPNGDPDYCDPEIFPVLWSENH